MPRKLISKRSDPQVQFLRKIRDGKERSLIFCEGEKLTIELFGSNWQPVAIYCSKDKLKLAEKLGSEKQSVPIHLLDDSVMSFCSDLTTPQGIIVLAKAPHVSGALSSKNSPELSLVIHGVQLPQNVGALLRIAEASGVMNIFVTPTTADPWGPKALRGSAGSSFRMNIQRKSSLAEVMAYFQSAQITTLAATQNGKIRYDKTNWRRPVALVLGAEGQGFSKEELEQVNETIFIPMKGRVESLNVATAAAVCLFEAARQRND